MTAPVPIFAQVQAGMIGALRAASAADGMPLGFRFRQVASYGDQYDDNGLRRVVADFPAAWVVFTGERAVREIAPDAWSADGEFSVLVGAKLLSSEAAGREGRGGEPGSYQLIDAVRRVLLGQSFGLDIAPLVPMPVRALTNDVTAKSLLSVYIVPFRTRYTVEAVVDFDDFAIGTFTWRRPESDGAPEGGTPVGTDTIALETA